MVKKGEGNFSGHGSDQGGFGKAIVNGGVDDSLGAAFGNNIDHYGAKEHTYDPDEISILDTLVAGSFENARHKKIRDQLVKNVLYMPVKPIVNVIKTLNNERELDQNDWNLVAAYCNNGGIDLGVVGQDGQIRAMFMAEGNPLVIGTNANGTQGWAGLNNSSIRDESSRLAEVRLKGLNKAVNIQLGNQPRIFVTGIPYKDLALPLVSQSGQLTVQGPTLYAGANLQLPSLPAGLVFTKSID